MKIWEGEEIYRKKRRCERGTKYVINKISALASSRSPRSPLRGCATSANEWRNDLVPSEGVLIWAHYLIGYLCQGAPRKEGTSHKYVACR